MRRYLSLEPALNQAGTLAWWKKNEQQDCMLSTVEHLHPGVRPGAVDGVEFAAQAATFKDTKGTKISLD